MLGLLWQMHCVRLATKKNKNLHRYEINFTQVMYFPDDQARFANIIRDT